MEIFVEKKVEVPPSLDDEEEMVLSFYMNCPKYKKYVINNNNTYAEIYKLEAGEDYRDMVEEVRAIAGVDVTYAEVDLMWNMCRYEMAWWPLQSSPWCDLFSEEKLFICTCKPNKVCCFHAYSGDLLH